MLLLGPRPCQEHSSLTLLTSQGCHHPWLEALPILVSLLSFATPAAMISECLLLSLALHAPLSTDPVMAVALSPESRALI